MVLLKSRQIDNLSPAFLRFLSPARWRQAGHDINTAGGRGIDRLIIWMHDSIQIITFRAWAVSFLAVLFLYTPGVCLNTVPMN